MSHSEFKALGLSADLLKIIERKGFTQPSPIQAMAIPLVLEDKHDVIAQAQTGTGKTAAFALPILEKIHALGYVQALIMVPTRELAIQVATEINSLRVDKELEVLSIYGGASMQDQLRSLKRGVDVVVATPGRLLDHLERRSIQLGKIKYVVLDEADEMLRMGFIDDIEEILKSCPPKRRTLLFSATMPKPIMDITDKYMTDKKVVSVKKDPDAVNLTDQVYYEVRRSERLETLAQLIELEDDFYGVIFCRTKLDVDDLTKELLGHGYAVEALHGDVSQSTRESRLKKFKARKSSILVATDVAARGIDVSDLTHVVNYSLPQSGEIYVHRIGRTGRAGKKGIAITFVAPAELRGFGQMIRGINAQVRKADSPKAQDVLQSKAKRLKQGIDGILEKGTKHIFQKMAEELVADNEAIDILAALLQQSFQTSVESKPRQSHDSDVGEGGFRKKSGTNSRNDARRSPPKSFNPGRREARSDSRRDSAKPDARGEKRGDFRKESPSRGEPRGEPRSEARTERRGESRAKSGGEGRREFKAGGKAGARHNSTGFTHRKSTDGKSGGGKRTPRS